MKKIKKLLPVLLMSIMSVSAFAEEAIIDGIKYDLSTETLNAEVRSNSDNPYSYNMTIPETVYYNGKTYSVTSIGDGAFYGCSGLTSIIIPNSVTNIGDYAFYECSGLKSVVIPNSITSIGRYVFCDCTGLTSVTIPNSVTSIGKRAFSGCSGLTSITIPNSVTSIGDWAFSECSGLTSITIPNSVTSIGDGAFYGCSGLTSVISLIEEPFEINENTFYNWVEYHDEFTTATLYVPAETKSKYESTPAWNMFESIQEDGAIIDGIKYYLTHALEAIVVDNTYIPYSGDIVIPETVNYNGRTYSVLSIDNCAFLNCTGLTSVTIPNSIIGIKNYAFEGCTALTSVISMIEEPFEINDGVFSNYNAYTESYEFTKTTTLYVPMGTKAKYESTPAWNKFANIVEGIENTVESAEIDTKVVETERYNVSGQRIGTPQKGLNIMKMSDGTTRKVVVK